MRPRTGPFDLNGATQQWARTWVEIDWSALRRNSVRLAERLPAGGQLIVSAKKDGYGHGLAGLAATLADFERLGALGLATIEEAVALRDAGCRLPLLLFTVLHGAALEAAIARDVLLTVTSLEEAAEVAHAARRLGTTARAHFKLDTGMGRLGRLDREVQGEIPALCALEGLNIEALYTHLATAGSDPVFGREQYRRLVEFGRASALAHLPRHLGGSDAFGLGLGGETGLSLRAGIAVYGDHPAVPGLEPVMTFKSRVVYRRAVPAGTPISYGHLITTTRPTELAVVGVGYGNGYLRNLSAKGAEVLLHGRRCPLLGRVCMDQIIVDVTDLPAVAVGDEAVLFGVQRGPWGEAVLSAAEPAAIVGTISYELFCLAGQINPRREMKQ